MKLTATEIREKNFEKNFRGYDKDEVTEFLKNLAEAWDKLENEKIDLERRLQYAEQEAKKLKEVEVSLFRTLKTAEDTGASIIEEANRTAQELLTDAHLSSDKMVRDAQIQAQRILEDTEKRSAETLNELKNRIKGSIRDFDALVNNRNIILKNLKKISSDLEETLTKSEKDLENSNNVSFSDLLDNLNEVKTPHNQLSPQKKVQPIASQQSEDAGVPTLKSVSPELLDERKETPVPEKTIEAPTPEPFLSDEASETVKSETQKKVETTASISVGTPTKTSQEVSEPTETEQKKDKKEGSFFDQLD